MIIQKIFNGAFANSIHASDFARFKLPALYEFQHREGMQVEDFRRVFNGEYLIHFIKLYQIKLIFSNI